MSISVMSVRRVAIRPRFPAAGSVVDHGNAPARCMSIAIMPRGSPIGTWLWSAFSIMALRSFVVCLATPGGRQRAKRALGAEPGGSIQRTAFFLQLLGGFQPGSLYFLRLARHFRL